MTSWNIEGAEDSVLEKGSLGYNSGCFMPGVTMDLARALGADRLANEYGIVSFKQSVNPMICLNQKILGTEGLPASQWLRSCFFLTAETSLVFQNGLALKL